MSLVKHNPNQKQKQKKKKQVIKLVTAAPPRQTRLNGTFNSNKLKDYKYAAALCDPWRFRDVRIPDNKTFPSFCGSMVYRGTATSVAGAGSGSTKTAMGFTLNVSAGSNTGQMAIIASGASNNWRLTPTGTFSNQAALQALASDYRVVSASVACFPSMSYTNNAGSMYMFASQPTGQIGYSSDIDIITQMNSLPYVKKCPVQMGHACAVNYWPMTEAANDYTPVGTTVGGGQLGVIFYGAPAGATFEYSVVLNLELLPNTAGFGIVDVHPSKCSYKAIELAYNAMAQEMFFATFEKDIFDFTNASSPGNFLAEGEGQNKYLAAIVDFLKDVPTHVRTATNIYTHINTAMQALSGGGLPSIKYKEGS